MPLKPSVAISCLLFLALTLTVPAAQYVAIKAGRLYDGNKEVGALEVDKVYECGGVNERDSRYIRVLIGGRYFEAEQGDLAAFKSVREKLAQKRDALLAALFSGAGGSQSAMAESRIAEIERALIVLDLQSQQLAGKSPEQLQAFEKAAQAAYAQQAEQRQQQSEAQRVPVDGGVTYNQYNQQNVNFPPPQPRPPAETNRYPVSGPLPVRGAVAVPLSPNAGEPAPRPKRNRPITTNRITPGNVPAVVPSLRQ